ncbi:MAG TPA: hypothetical protein VFX20_18270 [Steroidobacteraceae bacterium]|nr:hypothetical protein [Steroidobacteraceae bacterium]
MNKLLICGVALALTGCVTSKVATLEPGVYTLTFSDLTGMGTKTQAMKHVVGDADDYCAAHGGGQAHLVNMVDGRTMPLSPYQSSIVFRCVPK